MPVKKTTTITIYFKSIVPTENKSKTLPKKTASAKQEANGTETPPDIVSSTITSPRTKPVKSASPLRGEFCSLPSSAFLQSGKLA